ncbi:hypothetical protein [Intestinimonas butyriciproducens]|uniref:hypothetical protein n=1 Tax=Intestinimonas butyriciproducens TaxID=1297617 RepID=UPI0011CCA0DE|nr:hypothetical protein [Intestinimonas butyriciproducens]
MAFPAKFFSKFRKPPAHLLIGQFTPACSLQHIHKEVPTRWERETSAGRFSPSVGKHVVKRRLVEKRAEICADTGNKKAAANSSVVQRPSHYMGSLRLIFASCIVWLLPLSSCGIFQ